MVKSLKVDSTHLWIHVKYITHLDTFKIFLGKKHTLMKRGTNFFKEWLVYVGIIDLPAY